MKKLFILGNGVDWCEISLRGLLKNDNIYLINKKIPVKGKFKSKVAKYYFSYNLNKKIKMPLKNIWYKDIYNYVINNSDINDEIFFLIYDHNVFGGEYTFIKYLKKKIKNVKLYYIFTNIVKYTAAYEKSYVDKLNEWYDNVFAFDPVDSQKYDFDYSPLIYDVDDDYIPNSNIKNSVFYVGQAKDRLKMLIKSYEKLQKLGIECNFYIAGVNKCDQKYNNRIFYNKYITYSEAVNFIKTSSCLIDIIQEDSTGLTIKTCEAVIYDKKLITTNKHVKEYPFYDPRYIRIIDTIDDIDMEFFINNNQVKYSTDQKKYFSGENLLKKINFK